MLVHYDLSKSPATWDFCNFLARAELLRREKGEPDLQINIVPGDRDWSIRDKTVSKERRQWAARDLLPQLAWLVPSVTGVSLGQPGEQQLEYMNLGKNPGTIFKASEWATEQVSRTLKDKKYPISISVRSADFQEERNSNLRDWITIVGWLQDNGYDSIIVPSIERAGIYQSAGFTAATMNADIRLALYEQCHMNLMTNSGPMVMSLMSDIRMMAFKIIVPSIGVCSVQHMLASGFHPKADWGPNKYIYWKDDKAEIIIAELEKVLPTIEPKAVANG